MKKITCLMIAALLLFTSCLIGAAASDEVSAFAGSYEGWYYANQGQTGLTLTVNEDGTGVFEFYNMPGKSNAKDGSYTVSVSYDGGQYIIEGEEWIDQPSGYLFVSLSGTLDDGVYTGLVDGNSSWEFVLNKNNESYQQVEDSVYQNHSYRRFDEGLTWTQAKERCEELGGHLVTITSEAEQKFVEGLLEDGSKKQYWIGATTADGSPAWVTGEEFTYSNWDSSEPNSHTRADGEKEHYVHIYNTANPAVWGSKRFAWNDMYNDNTYPGEEDNFSADTIGFICEWETWSDSAEWSTPELQEAADIGLVPDVLVGKDMTQPVTRGEFAAISVKLFESMTGGRAVMSSECSFKDIAENENRNYILKAYNIGAVAGYSEDQFAPDEWITREDLAAMLCRVYKRSEWPEWTLATDDQFTINYSGVPKYADDEEISEYAKPSVYFMTKYGVISGIGDNRFAPKNTNTQQEAEKYANATREQALVMSLRSFKNLQ